MKKLQEVLEENGYDVAESSFVQIDGFDDACIGAALGGSRLVYDFEKMIDVLLASGVETREDAIEYIEFNIVQCLDIRSDMPIILETFC